MTLRLASILLAILMAAAPSSVPKDDQLPTLAKSLADRLATRQLAAPAGGQVAVSSILNEERTLRSLKTIAEGGGWPASWLIVQDKNQPHDLVLRVALAPDGTIADPDTIFLAPRRDWDDDALDQAVRAATGKKPPRDKQRNVVVQSFSTKIVTDYVYTLPAVGPAAKGLLALLPEGSLIRESAPVDLRDGFRHTVAVVLSRPTFVPADCATEEGRRIGHRDSGGILLVLAGEKALEDSLDITETVKGASGSALLPRFTCQPGDTAPGAIDTLVDSKFEGREAVRLLRFEGSTAQSELDHLPVMVGIKKTEAGFKLFAKPITR
ncbi:MAG TPA: hypothetical protein VFB67_03975 [Candidatus Polarisedimenticolaceae bacterium]|nr:hypothetical protein [Candidatus Polarisedimenticolaceae bacterium]